MVIRLVDRLTRGSIRRGQAVEMIARGHTLRGAGKLSAAVRLYDQALEALLPDSTKAARHVAEAYFARGLACRAAGRSEQMLADYTAALRWLQPESGLPVASAHDVYLHRANGRIRTGNLRGGEVDYLRACYLIPPEGGSLLPEDAYNHEQAMADTCRAIAWKSDLFAAYLGRAWLRGLQADWAGAARDYERGLHLMPDDGVGDLREKFRGLHAAALAHIPAVPPDPLQSVVAGYEYCVVSSGTEPDTARLRFLDDDQTLDLEEPVYTVREQLVHEGWRYVASAYGPDSAAHYYRRPDIQQ
jgi:tetratricopeptide (TPR) repeat protein